MTVSKDMYLRVIRNRPFKFSGEEVNYRDSEYEDECCGECFHFYTRNKDGYAVCEIFRDVSKKDEQPVKDQYVCDFFTEEGEEFPLLED
jgi:hypothetical protein